MAATEDQESQSSGTGSPTPSDDASTVARTTRTISRTRLISVDVLIGLTTVLLVVGMVSVYANRLLFSPQNWSNTSTQLLQDDKVRSATANYLVDQVYANVDVAGLIRSELPAPFQGLAGAASGALRNAAVQAADTALSRPLVQSLWRRANYAADQTLTNIVEGGNGAVSTNNGIVTLNLSEIARNVATRLGLPASVTSKIPPNVANLTVLKAKQLKTVQDIGNAVKGLALWLTIFVPTLYALAIGIAAGHRRRTLITVGFSAVFAGVLVFFVRSLLVSQVPGSLTHDASQQATIKDVVSISSGLLVEVAGAVTFVGAILVLCGWFAGPARPFVAVRRAMAPFLRENAIGTYGVTVALLALLFLWDPIPATHKPAGIVTFTVLALFGTEMLRRQTAREFPDARRGEATHAIRARMSARRPPPDRGLTAAPTTAATADQLRELSELRDKGALSEAEYRSAKEHVLDAKTGDRR